MKESWVRVTDRSELKPGERLMYSDGTDTVGLDDYRYVSEEGNGIVSDNGKQIYTAKELFDCWNEIYALRGDKEEAKKLAKKIADKLSAELSSMPDGKKMTTEEIEKLILNAME